jgi:hypothetical protein
MKAVLVGTHEGNRVYYDFDAPPGSRDGVIVREDGSTVKIYIISWSAKVKGLNQIRNTPFHRFFWDAPKIPTKGKWFEMFVKKSINVDKEILGKLKIESSLGRAKKKIEKKNLQVKKFMNYKTYGGMVDYKVTIPPNNEESSNDNV